MRTVRILPVLIYLFVGLNPVNAQWFGSPSERPATRSNVLDNLESSRKDGQARQRAVNLARSKAVAMNGGLANYRPENCMFSSQAEGCLIAQDRNGFTFRFKGGSPGWQQFGYSATYITEIRISSDGKEILEVVENSRL